MQSSWNFFQIEFSYLNKNVNCTKAFSYVGKCLRYNILCRSGEYKYCKRVGDQQVLLSINRPQDARCPLLLHFETLGQPFPILSAQWKNARLTIHKYYFEKITHTKLNIFHNKPNPNPIRPN